MNEKNLEFKPIKIANCVVVGGMIALGKTTIANKLSQVIKNSQWIPELDQKDDLSMMLLEKMYQRSNNDLYSSLFQLYFVIKRFDLYQKNCTKQKMTIFDRSIFEDWLFAKENFTNSFLFEYYQGTYKGICNQVVYEIGVPKLYVILKGDWELFKQRLFQRNRACEIENFAKNEIYFHRLLNQYDTFLTNTCKNFGIDYLVIDARLSLDEEIKLILEKLRSLDLKNK